MKYLENSYAQERVKIVLKLCLCLYLMDRIFPDGGVTKINMLVRRFRNRIKGMKVH